MTSFKEVFETYRWEQVKEEIYSKRPIDVELALSKNVRDLEDYKALVSPAGSEYLEDMVRLSQQETLRRFGKTIQLFAPMYLSNECQNICTYCGFSLNNKIKRKTLTKNEILKEGECLKDKGFKHILLVTGEANNIVDVDYFISAIKLIRPHFDNISLEVQPLDEVEYRKLISHGIHSVLVYQETYNETDYKKHHPKGKKSNFYYRLDTPDRLGRAGIHKIGLGVLIGLEDWRVDSFFVALHLEYLERTYWKTKFTISFPRLRPFSGGLPPKVEMNERELVQQIAAYRLFNNEVELSLSTRETQHFRNHAFKLGVTSMSAGSKTNPGGYAVEKQSLEQFEISDERGTSEISQLLINNGYEPVWKDWDKVFDDAYKS
ncbi:2-iminoacetate synthase ThiH [Mangrovivirga sp. M17]|uniref:2-iminoacetate synthase ThiH n=1 Tax=Mangrovivirga halotolerans TaxID=2993936 RepID=A0ABT3RUV2_9BACT|nr:2-iminoacetate synthase ThiH [Mangrovivirga halotolerans]MCX2745550.1 2-iminoacetate synthase ThiH [Mangrovivirga halotolerans]